MSRTRRYGTPGAGSFASNSGGESARPSGLVAERRVEGWSCSHWTYLLSFRYDHALSIRNPGRFRGISEEIFGSANLPASRGRPIGCKSYALNGFPTPGSPAERLNDVPLIRTGTGGVVNIGGFGQHAPRTPPRATGPSRWGPENVTLQAECPGGEIGRRNGLKIRYPHGCVGSIPTPGTIQVLPLRSNSRPSVTPQRFAGLTIV